LLVDVSGDSLLVINDSLLLLLDDSGICVLEILCVLFKVLLLLETIFLSSSLILSLMVKLIKWMSTGNETSSWMIEVLFLTNHKWQFDGC